MASMTAALSRTAISRRFSAIGRSYAARPTSRLPFLTGSARVQPVVPATGLLSPSLRGFAMQPAEMEMKTGSPVTRTITMVKKLTADGTVCRKCLDIEARLERDGLAEQIDSVIYMDPENASDEGAILASKHNVKVAPFFVVRTESGAHVNEDVYPVYMKMKREVFGAKVTASEANTDVALSIF